mmetsp:Transcript_34510/g.75825  ORF Transcript_34510/g.75825 Transcript_34510/m.75825 type:complete len:352 (+) Transcript_34510:231-1286(+)
MGDLNYRVNLPRAVVVDLLAREQIEPLLVQDQLLNAVRKSEAFHGFNEAPIGFAPTFKFVPNQAAGPGAFTRPLDERKKRVPSWCDRVLSRSWPGSRGDLEQLSYEAAPEVITSDHVPVHAGFLLKISSPWETEEAIHKRFYLLLYDLHASELRPTDQNGLADPYLEVRADFMDGAVRSSIKKRTLSPNWGHEQIRIRLPPYCRSAKYLEHAHLFIRVKDYDRYSRDDTCGCAVLGCSGLFVTEEANVAASQLHLRTSRTAEGKPFELLLTHHGVQRGTLSGRLRIEWASWLDFSHGLFQRSQGALGAVPASDRSSRRGSENSYHRSNSPSRGGMPHQFHAVLPQHETHHM